MAAACTSPPPTPVFLEVAQSLSRLVGLDVLRIIKGDAMVYKGLSFWLHHHSDRDPHGVVVVTRASGVPVGEDALKALLRLNYVTPAGVDGGFAMLPDSDDVVRCLRLDLRHVVEPVTVIQDYIESIVALRDRFLVTARQEVAKALADAVALA